MRARGYAYLIYDFKAKLLWLIRGLISSRIHWCLGTVSNFFSDIRSPWLYPSAACPPSDASCLRLKQQHKENTAQIKDGSIAIEPCVLKRQAFPLTYVLTAPRCTH